jgi:hypothetical protein
MALITKDKRNWASTHRTSFNKKDLVLGSVVKFGDDTYGMYVPKENFDLTYEIFYTDVRDIFLCYTIHRNNTLAMNLRTYTDNLMYKDSDYQYDVTQVYYDLVPEKDITKDFVKNFKSEIQKYVRGRKYIKR